MNRFLLKDLFREIRNNPGRYLSVLFIAALGVAFYTGIRSAEPDMRLSVDAYYDEANMMDVEVFSPIGMTQADVDAIAALEGVSSATGAHNVESYLFVGENELVVRLLSTDGNINQLTVMQGRAPQAEGECFVDAGLAGYGVQLGDKLSFYDEDGENPLKAQEYEVVGMGTYAYYLSWERGMASIGSGDVDAFVICPRDSFTNEYFTSVQLTCDAADGLTAYSSAYEDHIEALMADIETVGIPQAQIRLADVRAEAEEEIADAEQKIADAKTELADAQKEIADGEQELADARIEVADAEKELAEGRQELADAQKELEEGKQEYYDGLAEFADAQKQLEDARQELDDGWAEYYDGLEKLDDAQTQIDDGRREVADGEAALAAGQEELNTKKAETQTQLAEAENVAKLWSQAASMGGVYAQQAGAAMYADPGVQALFAQAGITPTSPDDPMFNAATFSGIVDAAKKTADEEFKKAQDAISAGSSELASASIELHNAQKEVDEGRAELEDALKTLEEGEEEYADGLAELQDGQAELYDAWLAILDGEKEIDDGYAELADAQAEIDDAWAEIEEGEADLAQGRIDFDEAKAEADVEIADAEKELADARELLAELDGEWIVLSRDESIQTYIEFGMDAERVGALGNVFPVIFFAVAALVSLTTMTRMVAEQRMQIGTLKALGYGKAAVAANYILYSLSATLIGGVLGALAGSTLFPLVIIGAYKMLYSNLAVMHMPINVGQCVAAVALAVLCTVGAAGFASYRTLLAQPAQLMRPPAPQAGKRIFLESMGALWQKMSFLWKATFRNLFRYKKRLFMTIIGIGGCMGLLMVGFGLRDSIQTIVEKQYKTVWLYDAYLTVSEEAAPGLDGALAAQYPEIIQTKFVRQESKDASFGGVTKSAYIFVPENTDGLDTFAVLRDRLSGQRYTLSDTGVVITEKLATMLEAQAGDTIQIKLSETKACDVYVDAVAENYLFHYIYMTPAFYEQVFAEPPAYNQLYLEFDGPQKSVAQEQALADGFLQNSDITGVMFVRAMEESAANMLRAMDYVIWVIIIGAGLLAYVVIYNLNNINITERRRELATLKVLGFTGGELTAYVFRENVILTLLGTVLGVGFGLVLDRFVILTCEVDSIMFGRAIMPESYLFSVILTLVFAGLVNIFMIGKLKKIDMVESLKSIE